MYSSWDIILKELIDNWGEVGTTYLWIGVYSAAWIGSVGICFLVPLDGRFNAKQQQFKDGES